MRKHLLEAHIRSSGASASMCLEIYISYVSEVVNDFNFRFADNDWL